MTPLAAVIACSLCALAGFGMGLALGGNDDWPQGTRLA